MVYLGWQGVKVLPYSKVGINSVYLIVNFYEILGHRQTKHMNEKYRRWNDPKITSASHTCAHTHTNICVYTPHMYIKYI